MDPSGLAAWITPKNVKTARIPRYSADRLSRRSIISARKAPQSMAVRMKPLPRATITSISGSSLPGVVSSVWKRSAGTNAGLPSLIWRRRATLGK